MLLQHQGAGKHPAVKADHGKMEIRIIILHPGDLLPGGNLRIQLLPDFPDQGLPGGFPGLDFPAGKLPPVLPGAVAPLGGKNSVPPADDGGGDTDGFHGKGSLPESIFAPLSHFSGKEERPIKNAGTAGMKGRARGAFISVRSGGRFPGLCPRLPAAGRTRRRRPGPESGIRDGNRCIPRIPGRRGRNWWWL